MGDDKISLEFLGEQMVRMQTDLREVRTDQARVETDLRADIADLGVEIGRVDARIDNLSASVDARFDNLSASVNARFDQVQTKMATNLEVLLKAIDAGRS